jgi:hypothetical protein
MPSSLTNSQETRVRVLRPAYAAGKIGVLVAREKAHSGKSTSRWLVKLVHAQILLSLQAEDFKVMDS